MRAFGRSVIVMVAVLLATPLVASSQTLTAVWDPNPSTDNVVSYEVCIGTASLSCNFKDATVTASQTTYTFIPNAGVLYRVAVRAISAAGAGVYSPEVSVSVPSLAVPANRTSTVNVPITPLTLTASDPDGGTLQYTHTGLPFGLSLNQSTGVISGTPTSTGTFNVTVFATDGLATASAAFVWTIQNSSDATPPTLSITSHTANQTVTTSSITLAGTATDSGAGGSGITGVTVNGVAATGGTATGSNTANWSRTVSLVSGANTLTVVATDGAGNARTAQITINRFVDTAAPSLSITSHASGDTVTLSSITLSGTATDNGSGGSGISSVTVNGAAATGGTASGNNTANWSRSVTLALGSNVLTVVATDGSGNARQLQITLSYAPATSGVVAKDSFTGTSGTTLTAHVPDISPGTRWVQRQGGMPTLVSGRTAESASSTGYGLVTLESGAADALVTADIVSTSAAPFGGIVVRAIDVNQLLLIRYAGNASIGLLGLFRRVNGSFELIDQITMSPMAAGSMHKLGAQLSGSQVQVMWDGVVMLTRTVPDYQTATQHGLLWYSDDPSTQFDNFVVTAGSAPAPAPAPAPANQAPVITGPSNQTSVTGSVVSVPILASDPEGSSLLYGASGVPSGVSVNATTGLLSGTLTASAGTYTVTVTASDGSLTGTRTFTWTVTAPSSAPAPAPPPGVVAKDTFAGTSGSAITGHVPDVSPGTMWVQNQGAIAVLSSGRVMESTSNSGYGLATLETGAADGSVVVDVLSNGGTPFAGIVLRAVDTNNQLLLRYAGNASIGLLGLFRRVNGSFQLIDQITISPMAPGSVHKLGAQMSGSQVQATWDGTVMFTRTVPDYQTATQHGLLWYSDDPYAYFDNFTVTASGTTSPAPTPTNAAPVITGPSNQTSVSGTTVSVPIVASDPEGAPLSYGAFGVPSGVSVNVSTGVLSGTLTAAAGTYTVTVSASDGSLTATRSFTWTVTAPAAAPPAGVVARDTFTGTSGTALTAHAPDVSPGTMWVQRSGAGAVLTNGRIGEPASSSGYGLATLETGASDGTVSVDMLSNGGYPYAGIVVRAVDESSLLLVRYTGNSSVGLLGLFRRVNGSFELLQQVTTAPIVPGTTHRLAVQVSGSQVRATLDGALMLSRTVTDYQTATQHGVLWHSDDPYAYFDNFSVTVP